MIAAAAGIAVARLRQLAGGRRDPRGRDRRRGDFPTAGGRRRDVPRSPIRRLRRSSARRSDVRRFFRMMLPGVIAAGIPQLTLIAGTIVASSSPSAVSWLTYSYRLYELPLGVVSIAIASVMTPAIAAHVRADDRAASAAAQSRAFEIALGLALPAAVGLGAAGRADRHRTVRARRLQRARHRGRRRRAGGDCARHPRPCAGEGAGVGVVRARGHPHADADRARRARGVGGRAPSSCSRSTAMSESRWRSRPAAG